MKPSTFFYKDCMNWLTEISHFRTRVTQICKDLQNAGINLSYEGDDEEAKRIIQNINVTNRKLNLIGMRIETTLNKSAHPHAKQPVSKTNYIYNNENELFDSMINGYNNLIELERSVNRYFWKNVTNS